MADSMTFPEIFEEFAEAYKIVDSKEVYTNGTELIPIFRVKQWLEHQGEKEVKHGYWKDRYGNKYDNHLYECSVCGKEPLYEFYSNELQQTKTRQVLSNSCPHCGAKMDERKEGVE